MLRHDPELRGDAAVAHRRAPRFPRFAPHGFEQGVPWPHDPCSKQQLDWGIQKILLQEMDDAMFQEVLLAQSRFHAQAPFDKQPLRNVAAVPVPLVPRSQLARSGVRLRGQSKLPRLSFKFRRPRRTDGE